MVNIFIYIDWKLSPQVNQYAILLDKLGIWCQQRAASGWSLHHSKIICICDGVQDTLSQNMTLWHIKYLTLKEFEKKWYKQEGCFEVTLLFFFSETGHKSPLTDPLLVPGGIKTLLQPDMENLGLRNLYKQIWLNKPLS